MVGKCISQVRIRLQTGKPRNASIKIRKVLGSKKREKFLEISRFPAARIHGWDSRTRTCKARVKVSCVAVTPYPIGIVRASGKGAFVRSFGIITQSSFLVNIQASPTRRRVFLRLCRSGVSFLGGIVFAGRAGGCGMHAILWRCAAEAMRGTPEAVRRGDAFPFRRTAVVAGVSDADGICGERRNGDGGSACAWYLRLACGCMRLVRRGSLGIGVRRCGLGTMRNVHGYARRRRCCVCGNTVRTGGYVLRRSRIICIMFRAFECARVSRVLCSAKSRRRLRRGGFFADLQ